MSKISGANLFKEPAKWPRIPPWWLLSSPTAAALLNVTPATLHNWRVRGEGPAAVPPMYLKPTQGDPIYYQFGVVRSWAAERLGLSYSIEDQCHDFYSPLIPPFADSERTIDDLAIKFDNIIAGERTRAKTGKPTLYIPLERLEEMDIYYSKQPRTLQPITMQASQT
ncbi:hypothetical protein DL239_20605 [Sedimentitalea sp. CY04]|uniref:Uncharacterized protein n=1 Tax=Parasedimentitalea denitrificans TaxID=2211118 RepID=A0ABX0WCF8_9RHOB|nr:hypothetical protein [Sedimentitalea sp. CY04]NIZ63371.1 hypothetical protein [Sedimentitalea sp. CY04]